MGRGGLDLPGLGNRGSQRRCYYSTITHKWSKTQIVWLNSTRLVIVIIIQNVGIQLEVESNNSRSFFIGSYTNIFQIGKFFSNSEGRSSYSLNLCGGSNTEQVWYLNVLHLLGF